MIIESQKLRHDVKSSLQAIDQGIVLLKDFECSDTEKNRILQSVLKKTEKIYNLLFDEEK